MERRVLKKILRVGEGGNSARAAASEKWSMILKDSSGYPKNTKRNLDINTIYSIYNGVLKRYTFKID